ncbi:HEPN domain-containing protein [Alloalcanivorax gelatiniphagus]|uniref:Apea-like HEPN domain-containing protein n=1 Tax=Alloalcanivorax gelatiniphagus TaxID=1194167 RepID=A0ABY2XS98_9GAMM|nr:HEPN domain-containing protein [Alloalcanivorax gelatiniphagus]TMW15208.1 hypothetical protein FGS76_00100 [Alloalcanivorax gelatiniphagus]
MQRTHQGLKARQRAERVGYSDNLGLRVHRALSWLDRAEHEADPDSRFIFLWIAFNAAYAKTLMIGFTSTSQPASKPPRKPLTTPWPDRIHRRCLSIVSSRIYILRNQIIHAGATWNGSVNRVQIRDCVAILGDLVPRVIEVMMDNPGGLWSEAGYPVVG